MNHSIKPTSYRIRGYIDTYLLNSVAGAWNRWFRHLIAGGIGTLLYISLVAVFVEIFLLHPITGTVISFFILELYTYIIFRKWVYNAQNPHITAVPRFIIATAVALFLNAGIMYLIVEIFHWWYGFGIICAAAILPPTNFLINYYWTFR